MGEGGVKCCSMLKEEMAFPLSEPSLSSALLKDSIPPESLRRVLIIKLRHHGDVLLTTPVFSALKALAPQCEIDALVYADTADMLTGHPDIQVVHTVDRHWKNQGFWAQAKAELSLLRMLQKPRYDLVIHLTEHWRGAWLVRLLKPRWSVAYRQAGRGQRWSARFTHLISQPKNALRHVVESNLDSLRRIGFQPPPNRPLTLVPGPQADQAALTHLKALGLVNQPFIHIHPASRWRFKCWTNSAMAELITALQAKGWPVVLTAAPEASEMALIEEIQSLLAQPALSLAGELSLKSLAALTAHARLFVGMDSAPMHIAAAMGTPVVALFGPSGERQWGAWPSGGSVRLLTSAHHPCRPCGIDGCGGGKISECLTAIPVETVLKAIEATLAA